MCSKHVAERNSRFAVAQKSVQSLYPDDTPRISRGIGEYEGCGGSVSGTDYSINGAHIAQLQVQRTGNRTPHCSHLDDST